ncbi:hypothetical protein B0T16DRAFT_394262 [Cercophora newfieldiana]|uniref:Ankyrin n=1 Tax=Cercophora newfieldiana TaxID=92897 RepID=A0AA40CM64_9PEZI|nr:hypothetical protein B0T16DRAFT_394262 [Cercophora newfieldiana]
MATTPCNTSSVLLNVDDLEASAEEGDDSGVTIHHWSEALEKAVLEVAASNGWSEVVLSMLRDGYDINGADDQGRTALYHYTRLDNKAMVEELIRQGADASSAHYALIVEVVRGERSLDDEDTKRMCGVLGDYCSSVGYGTS